VTVVLIIFTAVGITSFRSFKKIWALIFLSGLPNERLNSYTPTFFGWQNKFIVFIYHCCFIVIFTLIPICFISQIFLPFLECVKLNIFPIFSFKHWRNGTLLLLQSCVLLNRIKQAALYMTAVVKSTGNDFTDCSPVWSTVLHT
jgi:hypothetical protein